MGTPPCLLLRVCRSLDQLLAVAIIPQHPQYMQEGTRLFSHAEPGEDAGDDFLLCRAARQLANGV